MFDAIPAPGALQIRAPDAIPAPGAPQIRAPITAHIVHLWDSLGKQSQHRLECLAVSAGTATSEFAHTALCGALEMIAVEEGCEDEFEFAQTYLVVEWIAAWIANGRPPSGLSKAERQAAYRERAAAKKEGKRLEAEFKAEQKRLVQLANTMIRKAIAIDGEGVTLPDGSHVYRYMAACTSDGTVLDEIYEEGGISTRKCLAFLAGLPKRDEDGELYLGVFGYGLGYDTTKWLEDLTNEELYDLTHTAGFDAKAKCGPYQLNLLGKCLQITNIRASKGDRRTHVWDILKAFQSKFVSALELWQIGSKEEREWLTSMKNQRGNFVDSDWNEVRRYCKAECRLLAELVEKYVRAHVDAGVDLMGKYHGAGSTGDAMLTGMNAQAKKCTYETTELHDLEEAWSRSFFGGRSEISRMGLIKGPMYNYDVASAYPYALHQLPCVWHGKWQRIIAQGVSKLCPAAKLACVQYNVTGGPTAIPDDTEVLHGIESHAWKRRMTLTGIEGVPSPMAWGCLPYRTEGARIVFGADNPGGWAWWQEYRAAEKHWGPVQGVNAVEGFVLEGACECERPYAEIGNFYLKRLAWGKDGKGIVVKLGLNSCYGKFAQTIGSNPKYACRAIAGYITATCRARILEAIASAKDPWSVVYVATDGVIATAKLHPPDPPPNDTSEGALAKGKAPIGMWEESTKEGEYFFIQPGFYFSMADDPKEVMKYKLIKTRGVPVEAVVDARKEILDAWRTSPLTSVCGFKRTTFRGLKTSILPPSKHKPTYRRKANYGRWDDEAKEVKYVVNPKRSHPEPWLGAWGLGPGEESGHDHKPQATSPKSARGALSFRLWTWAIDLAMPLSARYKKDVGFEEERAARDDQPDFDETWGTDVGE